MPPLRLDRAVANGESCLLALAVREAFDSQQLAERGCRPAVAVAVELAAMSSP